MPLFKVGEKYFNTFAAAKLCAVREYKKIELWQDIGIDEIVVKKEIVVDPIFNSPKRKLELED